MDDKNPKKIPATYWIKAVLFAITAALLLGFALHPVFAQQNNVTDDEVNAVAKQLYCPVCENIPLDVCPTQACAQWRDLIRQKLNEGWSEQQIKDYFAAQYGERVLGEPRSPLIYILAAVFFIAGAAIVVSVIRRMRSTSQTVSTPPELPKVDEVYLAKLENELRQRNKS